MSLRRLLPCAAFVLALVPTASAAADQAVAEIGRAAPVAGYGGWEAWSTFDEPSGRYVLTLRDPASGALKTPLPSSKRPWDVSLGPDAHGNVVAIYQRCGSSGCDIRRMAVETGTEQTLKTVSSPSYDEATPAIWRSNVVFTRRVKGCDVPYVKDLRSSASSRRLLKSKCLQTDPGHASIRGSRIVISSVDLSGADSNGAGIKTAELRKYSSSAGGSQVIAKQSFGEESNYFGQVAQDDRFAYTVRVGIHPTNTFARISWSSGKLEEVRAFRTITDAFAKPSADSSLYVEQQGGAEAGSSPERFDDTGLRALTAADGSYRIVLPAAGADPWYTAVAATPAVPTWAGRGTVGSVAR